MKITVFEQGIAYELYIPPCDIRKVAEKCGLEALDAAEDKTPEDETMIAFLKAERRDFLDSACFTNREDKQVMCSGCNKPCNILHDLAISDCCFMKIK